MSADQITSARDVELLSMEVSNNVLQEAVRNARRLFVRDCDLQANTSLCAISNIHLSELLFSDCSVHSPFSFQFAPFVFRLEVSGCGLHAFSYSSESVKELVLRDNSLQSLDINCPFLFELDVCNNQLGDLQFLNGSPELLCLYIQNNRLSTLSFPKLSKIEVLDVCGNPINAKDFRGLITLRSLSDLSFTPPDVESVYQARGLVLGELMSRADEVSNVVGRNVFEDVYSASSAFYKQEFEARRKLAQLSIISPIDCGRATVCLMIPQALRINGKELTSQEVLYYKEWICPDNRILSMGSGIWYE